MKPLGSDAVRQTFLDFFTSSGHHLIGGASVLAKNDPTLLFVNSGMAPLKPYFTGEQQPPFTELTNVQPCIRTIDIADVGDRHHLTFFEMMGSWSIGGYFKQRAIELAFGLLTEGYGFSPDQLYVTIFEGDPALGLGPDEESAKAWESVGMARDHIVGQPTADNFWGPAGETGPCGPCTEVFLDTGDAYGQPWQPGREFDTKSRYIEIWNAGVFMQFFKDAAGSLSPLPFVSVDTGSGLERVTMALNGLDNVYETDLLLPIVHATQELFGDSGEILQRHRLITDHLRASCMIMAEGVQPSNEGAGYIPRRLLRRCLTEAVQGGLDQVSFAPVVDAVINRLAEHHPLLSERRDDLQRAVETECREFDAVIRRGLRRLEDALSSSSSALSGRDVFQLFATYGLPAEITQSLAAERGVQVDLEGYRAEFRKHQELSRGDGGKAVGAGAARLDDLPATEFLGYAGLTGTGTVLALVRDGERIERVTEGESAEVVLDRTPFYAEGGGQIGDRGRMTGDGVSLEVTDTKGRDGRRVHLATVTEGELAVGAVLQLEVDGERRAATAANHSATHLLNAALRQVLGTHVKQAGSIVEPERLRFDFTHPAPMTPDELRRVERLVNSWILADHERRTDEMPQAEAKQSGAVFLGAEEYGEVVRVVAFDGVSRELCGGTHVPHTSFIGSMRIRSEQSIASGVRRINAVTRFGALELAESDHDTLVTVAETLRSNPRDVVTATQRLVQTASKKAAAKPSASELTDVVEATSAAGVPSLVARLEADPKNARSTALELSRQRNRVVLLWSDSDGRSRVVVTVPDGLDVSATAAVKAVLAGVGGSGGGSDAVAQGGGSSFAGGPSPAELLAEFLG